eukprot:1146589-Pelagomonas_calceolata.AAC.1
MSFKALSKSYWGAGLANMDIGSGDNLSLISWRSTTFKSLHMHQIESYPLTSFQKHFLTNQDSRPAILMLYWLLPMKPNPLLLLLPLPDHTIMCYAADTTPH